MPENIRETAFAMETSSIKFGPGVTREVGFEMASLGAKKTMVVTDQQMAVLQPVSIVMESLKAAGIDAVLFDQVSVEPTDVSFKQAIAFAVDGNFDSYVAVGGGSSIDTAKAANLYATYPADFLTYVNAPIGKGELVPGRLKPLIAIPTTTGTGSETTGVAIFDLLEMKAKARPGYQGSNPISDIWSLKAIEMVSQNMYRAVLDAADTEARGQMALAATFAGVGFGNAGCHLPHGMSYPVAGMVREFAPDGYPSGHPIVPHGMSVILNSPAVFRFTAQTAPERHLHAAMLMGADVSDVGLEDAGDVLGDTIVTFIQDMGLPNGLGAVGYSSDDVPSLVQGTLPQHRVTKLSPRSAGVDELTQLFQDSLTLW